MRKTLEQSKYEFVMKIFKPINKEVFFMIYWRLVMMQYNQFLNWIVVMESLLYSVFDDFVCEKNKDH